MTDADYRLAFLAGILPAQAESLLYILKQAAGGIGLYMNINKTEFICFKPDRTIFILSGRSLKLVNQFTYIDSNISSTENDVNICIAKVDCY